MSWLRSVALGLATLALPWVAQAACPPVNSYPFTQGCTLPASSLNSALLLGYTDSAGHTAPTSPGVGYTWLNTTSSAAILNQWDGTQWVAQGTLDTVGHAWTPAIPSNAITAAMLQAGVAVSNLGFTPMNGANNLSEITNAGTARNNLLLGTSAVKTASGATGTVASVTGSFTPGDVLVAADSNGTVEDGGLPGAGTVTSVATGTGLTGGTITSTGTISLATIASHDILANITGSTAAPVANTLTATIDAAIGNTRGSILERGSSAWVLITPGVSGTVFTSNGAANDPTYQAVSGTGTVTSITPVTGITNTKGSGGTAITASGSLYGYYPIVTKSADYAVLDTDQDSLIELTGSSAKAFTLGQAGGSSLFLNGWQACFQQTGTGALTVKATTSTINGVAGATGILLTQYQTVCVTSDGTNYSAAVQSGSVFAASATTDTTVASNISSGTLPAARLPNPSSGTLGGIESLAAVSHEWINTISTAGVPAATQPAFTDISGSVAASQLPTPTSGTLGGVESHAAVSHQWINQIGTDGTISGSQPACTDLSGVAASCATDATNASNISSGTLSLSRISANVPIVGIEYVIDGAGSTLGTGVKGYLEVPFACTINRVTLLADVSGSVTIDLWKVAYGSFPPSVSNTITASAIPALSSAQSYQDSTLTGWTTSVSAGDIIAFDVKVASVTLTRVTVSLKCTKS